MAALAAANPALATFLSDPTVLGLLTDPTFTALLASGVVSTLAANPTILALVSDPAVQQAIASPVVGALLADPAALTLLLDARTQQLIASPANLPTIDVPVNLHRNRKALSTSGDELTMRETIDTTIVPSGAEMPGFPPTDVTLVVDNSTKKYIEGAASGRMGQWGLPFHVDKDTAYPSYISAARRPFDAVFQAEDTTNGLDTYRFLVSVSDAPMGADDPATGLPLVFDTETTVWVEPDTGAGVDAIVKDTVSALGSDGSKYVHFTNDIEYTDDTVARLIAESEDNKSRLWLYGTIVPLIIGILGVVMLGIAVGFFFTGRRSSSAAA